MVGFIVVNTGGIGLLMMNLLPELKELLSCCPDIELELIKVGIFGLIFLILCEIFNSVGLF